MVTRRRLMKQGMAAAGGVTALTLFGSTFSPQVSAQFDRSAEDEKGSPAMRRKPDFADLAYVENGHELQKLDIYLPTPTPTSANPVPVVVWIHGGAWVSGDKELVGVPYLLDDGYAIVSINYRLLQDALFPAQIQDANAAISWVWNHADDYGFDRARFVVGGSSAGGRSSSLSVLSTNDAAPEFESDPDVTISALLDFFGGAGVEGIKDRPRFRELVGDPANLPIIGLMDPIQFIDGDDPPTLIVHGEEDTTVPIEQSEALAAALNDAGVPCTFARIPDKGHGVVNFQTPDIQKIVRDFLVTALAG